MRSSSRCSTVCAALSFRTFVLFDAQTHRPNRSTHTHSEACINTFTHARKAETTCQIAGSHFCISHKHTYENIDKYIEIRTLTTCSRLVSGNIFLDSARQQSSCNKHLHVILRMIWIETRTIRPCFCAL